MSVVLDKADLRERAFARRAEARARLGATPPNGLAEVLAPHAGKVLAGYMPIRTEINPLPEMRAHDGPVAVPVIQAKGAPLKFALWSENTEMTRGEFGAMIPARPEYVTPEVLIVPLVAFDAAGNRLGYGGGFYDRTLEELRAAGNAIAIGFAFETQYFEQIPCEPTDQRLDVMVTDEKIRQFP
ncbi:5-formyltetrahydrofolate cyclo-ligase [Halocynthiibacter sp. C4]|uniref:5-formyltetrahydrofolate cyclo-ligase n=1 Tax=Halocynthiibacter sp. C4 TaxID=2992758 RepID=UPI00237B16C0|nr:5-formyltetrahydrofolate cyclo-ligase [Halocynthiibacter sp. C4]MDE0590215.1 5-formyltetrahydrofolate cyclo-ligase [Halocynthiibacter sp. C4]